MSDVTLTWHDYPRPAGCKIPKWYLAIAVASDGVIYVPAAFGGNEQAVMMCALYDGVTTTADKGHVYVPLTWLAKEFPFAKELCDAVEQKYKQMVEAKAELLR